MLTIPGLDEGDGTVVQVVNGWCTPAGWTLAGLYQETTGMPVTEQMPDPHGSYAGQTVMCNRYAPVTHTYAVLRRSKDAQVAELVGRAASAEAMLLEANKDAAKSKEALAVSEKRFEELSQNFGKRGLELDQIRKDLAAERSEVLARRRDLEKLRTAFGELRMKEILEE